MAGRRKDYLTTLVKAIDEARKIADELPGEDGWGGGFNLYERGHDLFGYCNTSDLLSDLAATIEEFAKEEAA